MAYFDRMMTRPQAGGYFNPMMVSPPQATGPVAPAPDPFREMQNRLQDERSGGAPQLAIMGSNLPPPSAPVAMNAFGPAGIARQPMSMAAPETPMRMGAPAPEPYSNTGLGQGQQGGDLAQILGGGAGPNYGRRESDRADSGGEPEPMRPTDPKYEKYKADLIKAMGNYANYRGPERDKFERKPKRFDEDDLRKMQMRERAGMEPMVRQIESIKEILGLMQPQKPHYEEVDGHLIQTDSPGGPRSVWEPPAAPAKPPTWMDLAPGHEAVLPGPGGVMQRIAGPQATAPAYSERPFAVGGQVYLPGENRFVAPPGGVIPEGLPASVAGRAVDAGINPVHPSDPNYGLYQRVISGTATKAEQALMAQANQVWQRAREERLKQSGQFSFGEAPSEAQLVESATFADRIRSDYLKQAQAGVQPGAAPAPTQPGAARPPSAVRYQQLIDEGKTPDQAEETMVDEGYGG